MAVWSIDDVKGGFPLDLLGSERLTSALKRPRIVGASRRAAGAVNVGQCAGRIDYLAQFRGEVAGVFVAAACRQHAVPASSAGSS